MNEQELRELLAEQASVIHELRREAAGMSATIATLRALLDGRERSKKRRQTREATVWRCDRNEGEHPWSDDETV